LPVLAIALEELVDFVLLGAFVKLGKDAPIIHVDKTIIMSERDGYR
jgi:hypothetical protein